jgi:hypothetical protein
MSKNRFPFYFWKKYFKKVYGQKGASQVGIIYAVVTEIIIETVTLYMVTKL